MTRLIELTETPPTRALDNALLSIRESYGAATADVVAAQLEYPTVSAGNPGGEATGSLTRASGRKSTQLSASSWE